MGCPPASCRVFVALPTLSSLLLLYFCLYSTFRSVCPAGGTCTAHSAISPVSVTDPDSPSVFFAQFCHFLWLLFFFLTITGGRSESAGNCCFHFVYPGFISVVCERRCRWRPLPIGRRRSTSFGSVNGLALFSVNCKKAPASPSSLLFPPLVSVRRASLAVPVRSCP